ncbi:MarR family winged helix-turn-helix transcriptional regulator [uncultured Friedmanniella sp.]|uniref:MarR family winged helix-turn-helix transcriptional regulator n=1 Tax=uncultured Friedmanniella sp. TaxID=335381 RepID=UPI0035CBEF83
MDTECYCTTLRAATRRLTARYDAALEPVGVNVAQWGLLRKLARPPGEPISIQELADRTELERSTAARNVRVLEKHGLVRLGGSAGDRRLALIELTEQGLAVLHLGEPLWHQAQREVQTLLGGDQAIELRSLLHAV